MQAHIVTGVAKNIDELADRQMLQADKNVIYIVKKSGNGESILSIYSGMMVP